MINDFMGPRLFHYVQIHHFNECLEEFVTHCLSIYVYNFITKHKQSLILRHLQHKQNSKLYDPQLVLKHFMRQKTWCWQNENSTWLSWNNHLWSLLLLKNQFNAVIIENRIINWAKQVFYIVDINQKEIYAKYK